MSKILYRISALNVAHMLAAVEHNTDHSADTELELKLGDAGKRIQVRYNPRAVGAQVIVSDDYREERYGTRHEFNTAYELEA